ncbi:MAG: hypothetical protein JWN48_1629 [Myxococcaceae bacterium]|nr:hypothetical protein [Myxococcaceae bacterium]
MLTPVLILILWTFVIWFWMLATRLPAMRRAKIDARVMNRDQMNVLPQTVKRVADNYNHLHEQPTLFYALAFYTQLTGMDDIANQRLAWAYVVLRIAHSLVQATIDYVPLRFGFFVISSIALIAIGTRDLIALCCS